MDIFTGGYNLLSGEIDLTTAKCALVERKISYSGMNYNDYREVNVQGLPSGGVNCNVYVARTNNQYGPAYGLYVNPIIFPVVYSEHFDGALIYFDQYHQPALLYITNYDSPYFYVFNKRPQIRFKDNLIRYLY